MAFVFVLRLLLSLPGRCFSASTSTSIASTLNFSATTTVATVFPSSTAIVAAAIHAFAAINVDFS